MTAPEPRERPLEVTPMPGMGVTSTTVPSLTGTEERVPLEGISVQPVLSPTQQAGLRLAIWVGALISVVTIATILAWGVEFWLHQPPSLPSTLPTDPAELAQLASSFGRLSADYNALADARQARITGFFDTVVARTILPVFTAILGYIFATQVTGRAGS